MKISIGHVAEQGGKSVIWHTLILIKRVTDHCLYGKSCSFIVSKHEITQNHFHEPYFTMAEFNIYIDLLRDIYCKRFYFLSS